MSRPLPREPWLSDAAERIARLETWRAAHPQADWSAIEDALDDEVFALRARWLTDLVQASAAAAGTERPACPACGAQTHAAGQRVRHLTTERNQPVRLERTYVRCPTCGAGFFPPG